MCKALLKTEQLKIHEEFIFLKMESYICFQYEKKQPLIV